MFLISSKGFIKSIIYLSFQHRYHYQFYDTDMIDTHFSAINYIILLGKMYIYRQKTNESTIYFNYFLNELKFKLNVEKTICETKSTLTQFNKKWATILEFQVLDDNFSANQDTLSLLNLNSDAFNYLNNHQ